MFPLNDAIMKGVCESMMAKNMPHGTTTQWYFFSGNGTNLQPLIITLSMIGKFGISACFGSVFLYAPELFPTSIRYSAARSCEISPATLLWRHNGGESPASQLFTQPFIRSQIKENIKAPRHWPLCGEFTGDRWIPHTNGQLRGKCFHLMTSSWLRKNLPCTLKLYSKSRVAMEVCKN